MSVDDIRHYTMGALLSLCPLCNLYYYYSAGAARNGQAAAANVDRKRGSNNSFVFLSHFSQLCLLTKWPEGGANSVH